MLLYFHIFRFLLDLTSEVNGTLTVKPSGFHGKDVTAVMKVSDNEIAETDYLKAEQGKYE